MEFDFRRVTLAASLLPAWLGGAMLLAGLILGAQPVAAQATPKVGTPVVPTAEPKNTRQPLPPALPGARTSGASATAPDRPPSEMSPNDALFDAINRGDIAHVLDA